jgi:transaldolase
MLSKSPFERLQQLNDEFEIWWDASPLAYAPWKEKFLAGIEDTKKEKFAGWLDKLYNDKHPEKSVFRGVTTNPRITRETLDWIPEECTPWIKEIKEKYQGCSLEELAWMTYTKITEEGVKKYLPLFEASNYKYGHVSAQVDPRLLTDTREMLRQGIGLKALSPNIMIKSPATKEGIYNIMLLTALAIPTNATVCFTLPQILAVAEAVRKGKELGEANGVDYSQWRSVITMMLGRFEETKEFNEQAAAAGIELTDEVRHWAGLAVSKKAVRILKQEGYESKLLLCSSRPGPVVDNKQKVWHIEKMAGEPIVYTINPAMIGDFCKLYENEPIADHRNEEIPDNILAKLIQLPYFRQGYFAHGMTADQFVAHPASIYTANGFANDMRLLEEFVEKV